MAITLSRLMSGAEENYSIKLLAGRAGMKSPVRWVHMVEDQEVPSFLHGGELVFTTGIAHDREHTQWLLPFVQSLQEVGAVALVLNAGPYIPSVPPDVIDFCNRNDFPLGVIPWERRLIDVTYELCHRIIAAEADESDLVRAFRAILFERSDRESHLALLARRGFYHTGSYTLMLLAARRSGVRLPAEEWDPMKFGLLETVTECFDKPFFLFTQENYLAVIGTGVDGAEMAQCFSLLQQRQFSHLPECSVSAGISDTGVGFSALAAGYRQARAAVSAAETKKADVLRYAELGTEKLLFGVEDQGVLRRYLDDTLGAVLRYDAAHNSDYCHVLHCYLRHDGSIQQAAEELGVHRNTINYKLKTMRALFGLTLGIGDISALYLAFQAREIIENQV